MSELELRTLATRDSMTGALSRRAWRDEATRALSLARRHQHGLSCLIFDLDHFKTINDENGHATGDQVLTACVDVCRRELREADLIGRIGGEEFAVLLPHTHRDAALKVADKIRTAFTRLSVQGKSGLLNISASFGIAPLDGSVIDIDELLKRADTALYAAKADGRNTCKFWQAPEAVQAGTLRRVFKAGLITFNAGHSTIDCTVRGLSDIGANLDVSSSADIPELFKLQIGVDNLYRLCRVMSKRDKHLEVAFEQ